MTETNWENAAKLFASLYYDHSIDGTDNQELFWDLLRQYGWVDEDDEWIYDE